jgi:hypothetical protein
VKDLPKVFQNNVNKDFKNNNNVFYSRNSAIQNEVKDSKTILQKINDIFSSQNYVYKANVEITLKDKKITKRIIGRNKNYIITMDNMLIPITDIVDIKSIKK